MRLARFTWIKTAVVFLSGLASGACAAAALPIELISVNTLGQQATLSFGNSNRGSATNSTSGISFDGTRIGYVTRDQNFALDAQAQASSYGQLMQWRRGVPGSIKSVQAPVGQTTITDSTFDKPGSEFCFKAFGRDFVTTKQTGVNFFCKQADGSYQYAGAFGPNNYLPDFVVSFRGGVGFDIYKFDYNREVAPLGIQVAVRDRSTGTIDFVSVNNQGEFAANDTVLADCNSDASFWPYAEVSNDGRYALFDSCAPNLVPGDTSVSREGTDLFIRDRVLRTTTRIMREDGQEFSGTMYDYDLSRDGRFAVFAAGGVVTQDCAEFFGPHAYLYEIATRRLECISRDVNGALTDNAIFQVMRLQISDDARFMAYTTRAALDPRDTNEVPDVYLYDRIKRRSVLISDTHDGQVSNDWSTFPLISGDGNWVAFQSFASNLIPNDQNGRIADVFVRDLRPLRAGEMQIIQASTLSIGSLIILAAFTLGLGVFAARRLV
jgi:hypothetical protein